MEDQCKEIAKLEKRDGGPLVIEEVQYRNDFGSFPFTIFCPFTIGLDL